MKKKTPSKTEEFKPVLLYFDDLEKIIESLNTLPGNVSLETDEYVYESLDDLSKHSDYEIYNLEISVGEYNQLRLLLTPYAASLYISHDNAEYRGVFEKIKEILMKRERIYRRFISTPWAVALSFLAILLIILAAFTSLNILASVYFTSVLLGAVVMTWVILERGKHSIIVLRRQANQISFWKRNKDQIWLLIIGTSIGVIGTILVDFLLKN